MIIICLLSVFKPGVQPKLEELLAGISSNSDGSGFAIATKSGSLIVEHAIGSTTYTESTYTDGKGQTRGTHRAIVDTDPLEDLARRFVKLRKRHPEGPALFHSRFATGGTEDLRGCHPYRIGIGAGETTGQSVLAHNGVMFAVPGGDWRSDTRIFAEDRLPQQFAKFWRPQVKARIEEFLGGGNKIAIITVDKRKMTRVRGQLSTEPFELFIFNERLGQYTPEGAWHSNGGYRSYSWKAGKTGSSYSNYSTKYGQEDYDYQWEPNWKKSGSTTSIYRGGTSSVTNGAETGTGYPASDTAGWDWRSNKNPDNALLGEADCAFCGGKDQINPITNVCGCCQTCADCSQLEGEGCECYVPGTAKVPANTPLAITAGLPAVRPLPAGTELSWEDYLGQRPGDAVPVPFRSAGPWAPADRGTADDPRENYYDLAGFDPDGFDRDGYNLEGYNRNGLQRGDDDVEASLNEEAWLAQQSMLAAGRDSDERWLAELGADYASSQEDRDLSRREGEDGDEAWRAAGVEVVHLPVPDLASLVDDDEPGVIRRLV